MLRTIIVALSLLLPCAATAAKLQALNAGDFAAAWLIPDSDATSLKLTLYVLTGERDGEGAEGLAHYVEHLAWENMQEDGAEPRAGHSNAFTGTDLMGYWLSGEIEQAPELLRDLVKVLQPLRVEEQFALEEREIIQREYDYRERENWRAVAWRALQRRLHADDPRRRDIGGSPEVISQYSLDEGRRLHQLTHTPANAVLVLRGDLSKSAANKLLKNTLGLGRGKKAKSLPRSEHTDYQMAALGRDVQHTTYAGVTQPELLYAKVVRLPQARAIAELFSEVALLDQLLASRLDGGLLLPLHYDNFFANDLNLEISVLDQQHLLLYLEAVPDVDVSLSSLLQAIESELEKSARAGLQEDVVNEIKRRAVEQFQLSDHSYWQSQLLQYYLQMREMPVGVKKQLKILKRSDAESLTQLLRSIAGEGRVVVELVESQQESTQ